MSNNNRAKLETAIERSVYRLIDVITEHTHDFVHIYAMRNGLFQTEEEKAIMKRTLEIVRTGIKDGFMTKVDGFSANIKKGLDEYTSEESPSKPVRTPK